MWLLFVYFFFQIFHAFIIVTAVIALVTVPVFLYYSGESSSCSRSDLNYNHIYGSCWRTLIDLKPEVDWYDIAAICTNSLTIILSICVVVASFFYNKRLIYFTSGLILLIAVSQIVITGIYGGNILYAGASIDSEMTHKIESSLRSSLFYYDDNNPDVRDAWDNLMDSECCCGAFGFSDFESLGKDIPSVCQCKKDKRYDHEYDYYYGQCYKTCKNSSYIAKGCHNSMMEHVYYKFKDLKIAECVVIFSIACLHLIVMIIAMSSLSCSLRKKQGEVSTLTQHLILDDTETDNKLVGASDRDPIVA